MASGAAHCCAPASLQLLFASMLPLRALEIGSVLHPVLANGLSRRPDCRRRGEWNAAASRLALIACMMVCCHTECELPWHVSRRAPAERDEHYTQLDCRAAVRPVPL